MNVEALWTFLGIAYAAALAALMVLFILHGRANARAQQAPPAVRGEDAGLRACRVCGCTEVEACPPYGCWWVEWDLCSACKPNAARHSSLEGRR